MSSFDFVRETRTMLKPFAASCKAYSLPMPSEAPVTTAQLPLRPNLESFSQLVSCFNVKDRHTHRSARQDEQTSNKSPEAEDFQRDVEETNTRKQGSNGLLPGILDECSHCVDRNNLMLLKGQESCLVSLQESIGLLPGAAGSGISASQGPRVQFHAPKTESSDVYLVLEASSC